MTAPKLVIDLERMNQLPKEKVGPLARYVATIQAQRGDYNGRVLSVRHEDLRSLAVIYDKSPADLTEELISWGVLDADARSTDHRVLLAPPLRGAAANPARPPGRSRWPGGRPQLADLRGRSPLAVHAERPLGH